MEEGAVRCPGRRSPRGHAVPRSHPPRAQKSSKVGVGAAGTQQVSPLYLLLSLYAASAANIPTLGLVLSSIRSLMET